MININLNSKKNNYILYSTDDMPETSSDEENMIQAYLKSAKQSNLSALDFWKNNEIMFPKLAVLARKYLSIQASSAAVERMFSISGHIHSLKRRR